MSSQLPIVKNWLQRAPKTFNFKGYCTRFVNSHLNHVLQNVVREIRWLPKSVQNTICLNVTHYRAHLELEFFFDGWCQKSIHAHVPCSRKRVIFKLKSNQKCYIFGDFLNCTMFNSSILGSLKSLDVVINFFVNVCVPHFGHLKPAWSDQIRCTYFRHSQAVQSFKWRLKQHSVVNFSEDT